MMLCRQLHESWDFDLLRIIWTAASLLVFCCQSDWIPKTIIKGSFLQEIPHITLPPLNHICSAKSSSSTCSNFALEKTSLSLFFQLSVVTFSSRAHKKKIFCLWTSALCWWSTRSTQNRFFWYFNLKKGLSCFVGHMLLITWLLFEDFLEWCPEKYRNPTKNCEWFYLILTL